MDCAVRLGVLPKLTASDQRTFGQVIAAVAAGLPVAVRRDPLLAIDIDTPSDLAHPLVQEVLPAWLPTNPANRTPLLR